MARVLGALFVAAVVAILIASVFGLGIEQRSSPPAALAQPSLLRATVPPAVRERVNGEIDEAPDAAENRSAADADDARAISALASNARHLGMGALSRRGKRSAKRVAPAVNSTLAERGAIVFFWHIVKTGGTTIRTVFQRQAQLGAFSFFYVTHLQSPQWYTIMHALATDIRPRRLLVEMHNPWGLHPVAFEQMKRVRELYRGTCAVVLVTFVRRPIPLLMSMYNWRVFAATPFCQWLPATDIQMRSLSGFPVVRTGRAARLLAPRQFSEDDARSLVTSGWDLVGLLERFDESLVALARLAGMRGVSFLRANSADHRGEWHLATQRVVSEAEGGRRQAAERALMYFTKMTERGLLVHKGRKPANCEWWGCRAELEAAQGVFRRGMCDGVSAEALWRTVAESQATDEVLYRLASAQLDGVLAATFSGGVGPDLGRLRRDNSNLRQLKLQGLARRTRPGSQGTCVGCGKEPFSQLNGCWPDWAFFSPAEDCLVCTRTWTKGSSVPNPALKVTPSILACYQDCWVISASAQSAAAERCQRSMSSEQLRALGQDGRVCSPACPAHAEPFADAVQRLRAPDLLGRARGSPRGVSVPVA